MIELVQNIGNLIEIPLIRQTLARGIICQQVSPLPMVFWVGGYGSFWGDKSHPRDIDLVVFVRPSFSWGEAEEDLLVRPLKGFFSLPVDLYSINDTALLSDEASAWRILFSTGIDLYGSKPHWL